MSAIALIFITLFIDINKPHSAPPLSEGMPMINAYYLSLNILVAARLELADLLLERPRSVVYLIQET